jgi:plastocyanin
VRSRSRTLGRVPGRLLLVGGIVVGGSVGLAACGGSSSAGGSGAGSTRTITIGNFAFSPEHDSVSPGERLTVKNTDSVDHTLTSTSGAFNTGPIMPDQSRTITAPRKAGSYPYRCTIHQFMTGTLIVK